MNPTLERCLEDLEERIDPDEEERLYQSWLDFVENRFQGDFFLPKRMRTNPPGLEYPFVSINSTLEDYDNMALQQYRLCSQQLEKADGYLATNVQFCNYRQNIIQYY
ncbi:MAG: hypothetical protein K0B14_11470 [Anaerolineaceae bacterium]|nr:hypothetical protein [Anaerolineaceae bacterium]